MAGDIGKENCLGLISKSELVSLYRFGYTFGRKIGEGSTASVYTAQYIEGARSVTVACKVYVESSMSEEFRRKFMPRELSILYTLDHENIIKLHSIVKGKGYFYLFTEYAEAGDLFDYLTSHGPLPESKAKIWFHQIVQGLKYLHRKEIAHRDIKCENILLSNGGETIKLADFGFTRYCIGGDGMRLRSTTFCGSTAYAAPEIIAGIPYDPKLADVWSSGVVLYVLLSGTLPFTDADPSRLYQNQMSKSWSFSSDVNISKQASYIVASMLEPEITRRVTVERISSSDWLRVCSLYKVKRRPKSA